MGKIIEIPFSRDLIEFVGDKLFDGREYTKDFSADIIVFPHKRPAFYLRRLMADRIKQPFFPPRMFSMDEFMSFISGRTAPGWRRINNLDSAYILFNLIREIPDNPWQKSAAFGDFLFWGLKLSQVLEELDLELIDNDKLESLKLIENWEMEVASKASHLTRHLAKIRDLFHSRLEGKHLTTRGRDYAKAAELVSNQCISLTFSTVYFTGHFALTNSEKAVIRNLLEAEPSPQAYLIRQNDGTNWKPFAETDTWAGKEEVKTLSDKISSSKPEISLHSVFNIHSEVKGVRDIFLNDKPDYETTAVVLPRSEPLIPLLSEVITTLDTDYNITMGYPLDRTPVYALLNLLLNLQENKREDTYYVKDYLALLMHPYIKNIRYPLESVHTRILIHSLEEALTDTNKNFIKLTEVENLPEIFDRALRMSRQEIPVGDFKKALEILHRTFIKKTTGIKTMSKLGEALEEILIFLLRHSPAVHYPFSGEFFQHFFLLLDKIQNSLLKDEKFKDSTNVFNLFRHLSTAEHVSFQGVPLKGLQILGLLESRCLNFEHVFLLDSNEGVLPPVDPGDSLMPLPVRAALGLPLHYQNEEIYRYHFHKLISSAGKVHIFYQQTEKESRSRFVEKLVWEMEKKASRTKILKPRPIEFNVSLRPSPVFEIPKDDNIIDTLKSMNYSPSDLNSYLICPLQFYFARVLLLEEKNRMSDEQDSAKIGITLHQVMEQLYRPLAGNEIMGDEEYNILEKNLPAVLDTVFTETFGELRGEAYLLKEMSFHHLKNYILKEKQQFINKVKVLSVEETLSCPFKIDDGTEIKLTGRADRIDCCEEEYMITDYKSGHDLTRHAFKNFDSIFLSREDMRGKVTSVQLPFYAFLYRNMYSLNPEKINSKLVSLKTMRENVLFRQGINRKEFMETVFPANLRNLIQEILNPDIPFRRDDRNEKSCSYCSFLTFCRKTC